MQQFGPQPYGPLLSPFWRTTNGEHPVAEQEPHPQLLVHVAVPPQFVTPEEQLSVDPGEHAPWSAHAPYPPHAQELEQERVAVPQLPHASVDVLPGEHAPWPPQAP